MKEEIVNGIKYCLDEETMTAEVIALRDDFEPDEAQLSLEKLLKMIFNGYEGDVIIPETVVFNELTYRITSVGAKAFAYCYSLNSVIIPDSVTSIGEFAFEDCRSLKSIVIPEGVTSIGDNAFLRCESLTSSVEIGEKIIGGINYLLYCNQTATVISKNGGYEGKIIIPDTVVFNELTYRVTSIGTEAFAWCESLKSIVIPDGVTSIGEGAFKYCNSLTKIAVPNSVSRIGDGAFEECRELTSVIIPNNVKSIGYMAFNLCFALTEIVIPNSVTSIGGLAFEGCSSLKSIVIPARVTEIEESTFVGCTALTNIMVADGNPKYDSRQNCNAIIETATNTLIRGCSQTIIPESVTKIGCNAFSSCPLTAITIPNSVTSIGKKAFAWCESLTSITFQGTTAQWEKIELDYDWNKRILTRVIHCADGVVEISHRK